MATLDTSPDPLVLNVSVASDKLLSSPILDRLVLSITLPLAYTVLSSDNCDAIARVWVVAFRLFSKYTAKSSFSP